MGDVDRIFGAFDQLSRLAQLRYLVSYALKAGERRCGDCYYWMKSRECPREHADGSGFSRGPSSGGLPCSKFNITQGSIDVQKSRIASAIEFAKQHNLPIPAHLEALS